MNFLSKLFFGNGGKQSSGEGVQFEVGIKGERVSAEVIAYKSYKVQIEGEQEDSSVGDSSTAANTVSQVSIAAPRRRAALDRSSRPLLDQSSVGSTFSVLNDNQALTSTQQLHSIVPLKQLKWSKWSRGCVHGAHKKFVLIKQFKSEEMSSFEIECMHRDIKLLQSVKQCQGIIQVQHQIEENDGTRLIFDGNAEFLDRILSNQNINSAQYLSEQDIVLGIVKPILHGLNYLHSAGILVRNLSAETVLISKSGAQISNLFLHADKKVHLPFDRVGDVMYMAPEVLNKPLPEDIFQMVMDHGIGENDLPVYDELSDIWCMGVLVFELLTGKLPFEGTTPEEVAEDQRSKLKRGNRLPLPPFLNELQIPEQAKMFIWECLKIQPENRKSAEQLLDHPWIQSQLKLQDNNSTTEFPALNKLVQSTINSHNML